ncbi:hypothetical protein K788_0004060 [Paraburkholderia caribensis MBA4]|uniref:Uncharacterized protein n=1 Tax=Paraburkholderia caribensis MBA4 TaxID=1323664 RepID=A0A0P0R4Y1_9BURK|nr:hypothetical protein K788_0004060 [Paraburkholderia caribensis MBA4]
MCVDSCVISTQKGAAGCPQAVRAWRAVNVERSVVRAVSERLRSAALDPVRAAFCFDGVRISPIA